MPSAEYSRAERAAGFYLPATPDQFDLTHMMVHVPGGGPLALAPRLRDIAAAVDAATLLRDTELPGSETDLTLQGMAMIIGYGIVMLGALTSCSDKQA
jgi:hypothetical protein